VLTKHPKSFSIPLGFDVLYELVKDDDSGIDALKVASWHLQHCSRAWVNSYNLATSFDSTNVEVSALLQSWMLWNVTLAISSSSPICWLGQLLVEVIVEQLVTEALCRVGEAQESLRDME